MLTVLVTTVLIFMYPPKGALMFPERTMVDAVSEDVWRSAAVIVFEKVVVFARTLEMVKLPLGFVIAVELRRNRDTLFAAIVV